MGYQALFKNKVGAFNVALGDGALLNNRTGSANIGIGEDGGFNITGDNNICIGNKGFAAQNGIIRIGTTGVHTATFIAGVITGDGSGLTGVTVPAASISGGIAGNQIVNNSITSTQLAPASVTTSQLAAASVTSAQLAGNLTLGGTTTGTFSGNVNAPAFTSGNAAVSNANGSVIFNPFPEEVGANLVGILTGATAGAQVRFQKSGNTDFIDIGQGSGEDFVVEGNNVIRLVVENGGNVGVGVASPNSKLHVSGDEVSSSLRVQNGGSTKLLVATNGGTSIGGYQPTPPVNGLFVTGDVGFGTSTPTSKLEVRGDIKLGTSGQFQAVAGTEKLRILRGEVLEDGTIITSSGFTITKLGTGQYRINYSTSFGATPTVTVTPVDIDGPQIATLTNIGHKSCIVKTWAVNGSAVDTAFHFIVVGAR